MIMAEYDNAQNIAPEQPRDSTEQAGSKAEYRGKKGHAAYVNCRWNELGNMPGDPYRGG